METNVEELARYEVRMGPSQEVWHWVFEPGGVVAAENPDGQVEGRCHWMIDGEDAVCVMRVSLDEVERLAHSLSLQGLARAFGEWSRSQMLTKSPS